MSRSCETKKIGEHPQQQLDFRNETKRVVAVNFVFVFFVVESFQLVITQVR